MASIEDLILEAKQRTASAVEGESIFAVVKLTDLEDSTKINECIFFEWHCSREKAQEKFNQIRRQYVWNEQVVSVDFKSESELDPDWVARFRDFKRYANSGL